MADLIYCEGASSRHGFSYAHCKTRGKSASEPHIDKDLFSVFVLLDGEIDYIVEGRQLHIRPKDMLLVGNNELHRRVLKENVLCEYIMLAINLDFFIKNNCTEFSDVVFKRAQGSNNIIPAKKVVESGLFEIVQRLDRYMSRSPANLTVASSVIIELLYHLNDQVVGTQKTDRKQASIQGILDFINGHLTEALSLGGIAKHFYLTEQYLCKLFKQNTGFTVRQYIAYKRVVLTREYYLKGSSLAAACEKAGFSDYSTFYRTYTKIMHEPPRKSLS